MNELLLQGGPALARGIAREKAEGVAPPLTLDRQAEISAIDALIVQVLKACKHGSTRNKKANPSYNQLALLIRCRSELMGGTPAKESSAAIASEIEAALAGAR
jgi:hypothetical protein